MDDLIRDAALGDPGEANQYGERHVKGVAFQGNVVAYEDMANPRRTYRVLEKIGGEYHLLWLGGAPLEDPDLPVWSDLRQHGWTFVG